VLTFDGLTDGHTYSLQGQDDDGTYVLFEPTAYHEIVTKLGATGNAGSSPSQEGNAS
jgi:hypothetical protein